MIDIEAMDQAAACKSAAAAAAKLGVSLSYAATFRRVANGLEVMAMTYLRLYRPRWTLFGLDRMIRQTEPSGHLDAVSEGEPRRETHRAKLHRMSRLIQGRRCSICHVSIPNGACRLCKMIRSVHGYKTPKS